MELRGFDAKSVLRALGPLTRMRFQNRRHRSFVLTVYDLLTRRLPLLTTRYNQAAVRRGSLQSSFRVSIAHSVRAILLASAIAATLRGLRWRIECSQDPGVVPLRVAHRMTDIAPIISSRRISRCPIFDVRPKICLPELCLNMGDAHHQAARFSVSSVTSTPSLNLIPSMTFGNWFLPLSRSHFFDAA